MGRQMFSQLQETRVPTCVMVTGKDKNHHPKCCPLPPSSPYWAQCHRVWNIPLVTCPVCVSSHALPISWPVWQHTNRKENALAPCKPCSAVTNNICIFSTQCLAQIQIIAPYQPLWRKLQPQPAQKEVLSPPKTLGINQTSVMYFL